MESETVNIFILSLLGLAGFVSLIMIARLSNRPEKNTERSSNNFDKPPSPEETKPSSPMTNQSDVNKRTLSPEQTKSCPLCEKSISIAAKACEHCGTSWKITSSSPPADTKNMKFIKGVVAVCVGGFLGYILIGIIFSPDKAASNIQMSLNSPFNNAPSGTFGSTSSFVENTVVKKIGKTYRYFFVVKNAKWGAKYDLNITLKTAAGMEFKAPLRAAEATGGAGFFADFRTGPSYVPDMGISGMKTFSYTLSDNQTFRKRGSGRISNTLESYRY